MPPPPRSNRQSWRCGQRHLRRSGLPQTWALALARAPAGEGAGPSCPKATARPRLTGRRQLPQRSGRLSLPLLPAPAGAPTGERAGRGPSPRRRRRKLGSVVVGASRPSRAARPAGQPAACGGQERGGRAAGGELRRRLRERSGRLPRVHGRTCWRPPPARGGGRGCFLPATPRAGCRPFDVRQCRGDLVDRCWAGWTTFDAPLQPAVECNSPSCSARGA